jgi:hypothetical protein
MYFQNPFTDEFRGNWVLGDRQQALTFPCPVNTGRGSDLITVWNEGPYNLAGVDSDGVNPTNILGIVFAISGDLYKNWATILINVAGAVPAVTLPAEVVAKLNADPTFNSFFIASLEQFPSGTDRVVVRVTNSSRKMKFYVQNGQAEEIVRFNARAGVSELPTYFTRHTVENRFIFEDSQNCLIPLDMTLNVDRAVVSNAVNANGITLGFDPAVVQPDWKLLKGRSGIFNFQIITVEVAAPNRITRIIEFGAGSKVGDMARSIQYSYPGVLTQPNRIWETPYQLTAVEIAITPP